MIVPNLPKTLPEVERKKDRISYAHQIIQVDLTKASVKETVAPTYELEIEFINVPQLMLEGRKEEMKQPNLYYEMIDVFLNTIRMYALSIVQVRLS